MKKTKKQGLKISTKIALAFSIIITLVAIMFYFLLPNLLNYPPNTIPGFLKNGLEDIVGNAASSFTMVIIHPSGWLTRKLTFFVENVAML